MFYFSIDKWASKTQFKYVYVYVHILMNLDIHSGVHKLFLTPIKCYIKNNNFSDSPHAMAAFVAVKSVQSSFSKLTFNLYRSVLNKVYFFLCTSKNILCLFYWRTVWLPHSSSVNYMENPLLIENNILVRKAYQKKQSAL